VRLEPVSAATKNAVLTYLARAPYLNVFISHVVLHDLASATRAKILVALDDGQVRGVAYFGRQLVLAADATALAPFAEYAKSYRGERMIVGPRETVSAYWELARAWHAPPRITRDRQLVMMIDREHLLPYDRRVSVRHALAREWKAVADSSAQMVEQELAYDPRRNAPDFSANIREMIARKLWWVGVAGSSLCFFCNVGPWCTTTAQLQGIWTPPQLRGQGLATAALAGICDRLLEVSTTLSLYVNDFNAAAIALYDRVGFKHVADFQTLLF
jgi:RimJ/RimL family protein N-acetyltransferase